VCDCSCCPGHLPDYKIFITKIAKKMIRQKRRSSSNENIEPPIKKIKTTTTQSTLGNELQLVNEEIDEFDSRMQWAQEQIERWKYQKETRITFKKQIEHQQQLPQQH
jgi:hypothetical protein